MPTEEVDKLEAQAAAAGGSEKRGYVRRIFSDIAPRYDLLNRLLSFNIDRGWRRAAIAAVGWERAPQAAYLDLCAGTLDVGAVLAHTSGFAGTIIAADFAEPMLRAGRGKAPETTLMPVAADALELPLANASVSGALVAFGIRNVADLDAGLREVRRVLAPGARFVILEFSRPPNAIVRAGYGLYSRHILPLVGRIVSGHPTAYRYLPDSIARFPVQDALAARMRDAGFANVHWRDLTFGVAALHIGENPAQA